MPTLVSLMNRITLILALILVGFTSCDNSAIDNHTSQNPYSGESNYEDSLNWEIQNSTNDTVSFNAYTGLLEFYIYSDLEVSRKYLDSLEIIAKKTQSDFFIGRHLLSKGDILDFESKVDEAELAYIASIEKLTLVDSKQDLGTAYNSLGYVQNHLGKTKLAISSYMKALEVRKEADDLSGVASTYNNIGYVYDNNGDITKALEYYTQSLRIREQLKDDSRIAQSLNNIAFVYQSTGDIPKAVDYYQRALKKFEKMRDDNGTSVCLNNIGILYQNQKDYDEALDHYQRSLKLISDKESIARTKSNIGFVYLKTGEYEKSKKYYTEALNYLRLYGDKISVAGCLTSIGNSIIEMSSSENPFNYYNEAMTIYKVQNHPIGIAEVNSGFSNFYLLKGNLAMAEKYAIEAFNLSNKVGFPENIKHSALALYEIYKRKGDSKKALKHHEIYLKMKNTIENKANQNAVLNSKFQIEYERQAAKDSVKIELDKKLVEIEHMNTLKAEESKKYILFGGLGFLLLIALVLVYAYQRKTKDNKIIESQKNEVEDQRDHAKKSQLYAEEQKLIVEEKNREILDSIQYAKRLQNAILPNEDDIKSNFKSHFILYKPKDIVAGDFYWFEKLEKENIRFIAVADCTGHGVPGAMVSVVCANALNKAVLEEGIRKPSEILERVKDIIVHTFEKSGEKINDGMDIALCKLDASNSVLEYSGANIPLIHIQQCEDKEIGFELNRIAPTKRPVGKYSIEIPFENHEIQINNNDRFFMYSDGYADQFGGENHDVGKPNGGKKLKTSNLRKLILSVQEKDFVEQKDYLDLMFYQWKGSLEQIDDICIVAFTVK
jgi:tetratricopeptide (TPR) repeat protein